MRIVFIGAVEFSLRALERLVAINAEVVGVCTLEKSTFNSDHVDLRGFSEANDIPTYYVDNINSTKTFAWIKDKSPDIIFCFGWSTLIKDELLNLAPLGIIGFHPALLPENRGRHPLIWALVLGLKRSGSTFFFMDSSADSGDILSQKEIIIDEQDDARSLYDKVVDTALMQIEDFIPQLTLGSYARSAQNKTLSNLWRKRTKVDGQIDWRMSAQSIHNLVRGLARPYNGAHFLLDGKEVKVWKTSVILNVPRNIEPGKVLAHSDQKIVIKCGVGAISLLSTEPIITQLTRDYI